MQHFNEGLQLEVERAQYFWAQTEPELLSSDLDEPELQQINCCACLKLSLHKWKPVL